MRNVKFLNAVITGSEFAGTDLTGADFEDALIGNEDAKRLCAPSPPMPLIPPQMDPFADTHMRTCNMLPSFECFLNYKPERSLCGHPK